MRLSAIKMLSLESGRPCMTQSAFWFRSRAMKVEAKPDRTSKGEEFSMPVTQAPLHLLSEAKITIVPALAKTISTQRLST